jgi:hypothetical protein
LRAREKVQLSDPNFNMDFLFVLSGQLEVILELMPAYRQLH